MLRGGEREVVHKVLMHAGAATLALGAALPALAQEKFPAELAGQAMLPAMTLVQPPADAPAALAVSGKFTLPGQRIDAVGTVAGTSFLSDKTAPRPTGLSLPFAGQPVQGFSGIETLKDGTFRVITDNGFGAKANSADAMLMVHTLRPDWASGVLSRLSTTFLADPDRKLPFVIVNEGTETRYLTGADLDIESVQQIGEDLWFGEEFGPYLLRTDRAGKVTGFFQTEVDGKVVHSPDHLAVATPAVPGKVSFEIRRSRGFEGMAASPDGRFLYPLLEGPLWIDATQTWETKDGKEVLRILEFDVQKQAWSGRSWKYALEANGNNIGDFNMIDGETGLIIERDNGEGEAAQACPAEPKPECFNIPARFKRVYKIDLSQADGEGVVKKIGYIDLLDIDDPKGLAHQGGHDGKLTFPFVTIENVDIVDADHIIVGNDNNLPYSTGRAIGRNDDNEMILLKVSDFLKAR
ncbi:esterase-like activity of phytase family protein [Rhodospirillum rubrum]|uniref:Phytase-like domain-containing protein n=1 Tax=Rhodospirillum rubrum (strain ATCC 11170 / ATH 1.1.1 / DSM 467 / LMG 4362 / NCIMB 8255 / S1) TaxID=269796 RepID=Q2RTM2_RHORT|nr:esterase-like activity of phytase family protein [Rhodospirillum rubrum]ABC22523.1 conserved hypothetical protein [Rhodospirillum rubrum ATCC 11170]MBK5954111.1 glycerophosphodiester phosphodiesterase [Rhodospirillum rubrum]HAQ00519.1 glycerophosphodiester phosphodiesterase [Rhodospirillum rubrum]HCF18692.1 glycerophosphodiester phosphodiesterase [Rhodospirillum rubrum]